MRLIDSLKTSHRRWLLSSFFFSFLFFRVLPPPPLLPFFFNPEFHSWPPCYTSAEEKPEETRCSVHAMRIIPIIETLFSHTRRVFNCCLLFQREIPPRYRDFNASGVVGGSRCLIAKRNSMGDASLNFGIWSSSFRASLHRDWGTFEIRGSVTRVQRNIMFLYNFHNNPV